MARVLITLAIARASNALTELNNLVSLCAFHHRRHHDGAFEIHAVSGEPIRFELSKRAVPRELDRGGGD